MIGLVLTLALTLTQLRNEVNNRLDQWWDNQVLPRQIQYAQTHPMGRYWQGLLLGYNLLPDNDDPNPALLEFAVPDDEVVGIAGSHVLGWKAAFPALPANVGFGAVCDEWQSPSGIGFKLTVYVRHKGTIYTRSRSYLEDKSTVTSAWEIVAP